MTQEMGEGTKKVVTILVPILVHTQSPEVLQNYNLSFPTSLWLQCLLLQENKPQLLLSGVAHLSRFQCGHLPHDLNSTDEEFKKCHPFSIYSGFL